MFGQLSSLVQGELFLVDVTFCPLKNIKQDLLIKKKTKINFIKKEELGTDV